MTSKITNSGGNLETRKEHALVPITLGKRGNKLLANDQRVANSPFGQNQVDCSSKAKK